VTVQLDVPLQVRMAPQVVPSLWQVTVFATQWPLPSQWSFAVQAAPSSHDWFEGAFV
jgi:hypothetical protein